jgi:exosortase
LDATIRKPLGSDAPIGVVGDLGKSKLWQILGLISAVGVLVVYWHTFVWWWEVWWGNESYYSHGVLIPFISAFIVYFNWKRIIKTPVVPSAWGAALLIPCMLVQIYAYRGGISSIAGLTFPVTLIAILLLLFGKRLTLELAFPVLFLYFMCVAPPSILDKASFKIQLMSTTFATDGLKLLGYSATQSGTVINLPSIVVEVAAPCSGFRMLIALLAFTTFFIYMKNGPLWARLSLIAFVFPLSVLVNSIRVLLIALVGEHFGQDTMMVFHDYSGYIVLVLAFLVLAQVAKVVKCRDFKSMPA